MLSQLACRVTDFSSQYGNDNTISYTAGNVTGKPTVYPNYGDSTQCFAFRTYGPWWSASSFSKDDVPFQDFIEVKLEKEICPYEFKIYETYNPGAVTRILGYDALARKWTVLWEGAPQSSPQVSRIFSPVLRANNFLTDTFRVEFCHRSLNYYCEIDAFEVVGSLVQFQNHQKPERRALVTDNTIAESARNKKTSITSLPSEVFNLVLSYLSLETLCRASQVSTFFRKHCYDCVLYQHLNLRLLWHRIGDDALRGLTSRCPFLQELNLSWCGSQNRISPDAFVAFIQKCGKNLLNVDFSNCPFFDSECLSALTATSKLLSSLSLKNNVYHGGLTTTIAEISQLTQLQCLNLYRTHVDTQSIVEIVKSCRRLEHLCLGACSKISNYDEVALQIGSCLGNLKTLDLWRARTLSAVGVQHVCNGCPDLENLDLGWCDFIDTSTGCVQQLAVKCPKLRRLILCSIRSLSNTDLLTVSLCCHRMEQIDILGTRDITPPAVEQFLILSRNLKLLDVSFSAQIHPSHVAAWNNMFPDVSIKQSFKPAIV